MRSLASLFLSLCVAASLALLSARFAHAQEAYFVRFQAEPTQADAVAEADRYAQTLSDVKVYTLNGGWYALALGPYSQPFAEITLQSLALAGAIPNDSFVTSQSELGEPVWPTAQQTAQSPQITPAAPQSATVRPVTTQQIASTAAPFVPTLDQRKDIQRVLAWQGLYTGAIDGIFGPASSRAIREWQGKSGLRPTGTLTTAEFEQLMNSYTALFDSVGMTRITDTRAGLALDLPMGLIKRTGEEAPFAIYEQPDGLAKVLLISMTGGQDDLAALYETMQSFDIMPREGSRYLRSNSFVITGNKGETAVYAEARRDGDMIKGFTLIWPRDDEERRTLLIDRMRSSVEWLSGTLSAAATVNFDADGFLSFAKRKASQIWSGVYINDSGHILTSLAPAPTCRDITTEKDWPVSEIARSAELGVRVLKPQDADFNPLRAVRISRSNVALGQEVHLFGYSFGRQALAPAYSVGKISAGTPADLASAGRQQLELLTLDGDLGAPLLDTRGNLRGIITPSAGPRALPEGFSWASLSTYLTPWLDEQAIPYATASDAEEDLGPTLRTHGYEAVALLQCWD